MTRLASRRGLVLCSGTAALANASPAQPLSDAPALSLDELQLAAAIRSQQALPDLVVDLDDRVDDLTVRVLARRYGVRFVADSSHVGHDRIYRVFIDKTGDQASRLSSLCARFVTIHWSKPRISSCSTRFRKPPPAR